MTATERAQAAALLERARRRLVVPLRIAAVVATAFFLVATSSGEEPKCDKETPLLELSPAVGAWFCRGVNAASGLLGIGGRCVLTSDVTDLVALVMIPLAVWYGVRRGKALGRA